FFPGVAGAFEVLANLLAAGTGCVEILLRVALDLRRATPSGCDFVTELAEFVGQFGLIDGSGELLGSEKTVRLDGAWLAFVALGDVENDCVCMQLRRDVA